MGILTDDMKRIINEQRLGFVASVCADGTPNLSPKGTICVWDDDHLVFADIHSPGTTANLRQNPAVEINVVDPILRKGYRFKGVAQVLTDGPEFEQLLVFYRQRGTNFPIKAIVLVEVQRAAAMVSPAYDNGATEAEVSQRWEAYRETLKERRQTEGSRQA